jgi:hypothetical protein
LFSTAQEIKSPRATESESTSSSYVFFLKFDHHDIKKKQQTIASHQKSLNIIIGNPGLA